MRLLATLANGSWLASSLPAWQRFRRALRDPAGAQSRALRGLLSRNAASAYGRAHGFRDIRTYEQFCTQVPVVDYDDLQPWIRRITRGEQSVLTEAPVTRLLPTSGSSGARKLIPFTGALQREFNSAIGPWLVDLCRQFPSVAAGPAYWSISPAFTAAEGEGTSVPVGFDDDSAYLGGFRQKLVEATLAVPPVLPLVSDPECSRYLTLLCLLRQPELRFISVWHPSFLTLLLDYLPSVWSELLHDLGRGGCKRASELPAALRRALAAAPQARRAAALRDAGPCDIQRIWPRLRVVSCWGDAQAALPMADLGSRISSVSLQPKGLFATEGFITIPFRGSHPVAVCSHFYEFEDAAGKIRRTHELLEGETYYVMVSTAGGLWRYKLGDQVEVEGFLESTPSLRFLGRGRKVSDLCGEKLHERFATEAIAAACRAAGISPAFAMLAPEIPATGSPCYVLFFQGESPMEIGPLLEKELRKNPHYALCRDLGQLAPLRCCLLGSSAYETFCRVGIESGRRMGDVKPEALSLRTDWSRHFNEAQLI